MPNASALSQRRTAVDDVFDSLHEQITTLELKPGDRISEADIAAKFGISRQPVRDAFSRLANLDLILIRPQRATEVRRFSMREIEKARFVRASVEKEVLRIASRLCDDAGANLLKAELQKQEKTVADKDVESFGKLDYQFHETICQIAGLDFIYDVILEAKAKVDRLCLLGLSKEQRLPDLLSDHEAIAQAIIDHDAEAATVAGERHLARLDDTIERISTTNASYFERED